MIKNIKVFLFSNIGFYSFLFFNFIVHKNWQVEENEKKNEFIERKNLLN